MKLMIDEVAGAALFSLGSWLAYGTGYGSTWRYRRFLTCIACVLLFVGLRFLL